MAKELVSKDIEVRGKVHTFTFLKTQDAVTILPITPEGEVIFVKQLRPAVNAQILELPAGKIEANEDPEQAAIRELEEETGYTAGEMNYHGFIYPSPGIATEKIHLFSTIVGERKQQNFDAGEDIEVIYIAKQDLPQAVFQGRIVDGKTLALLGLMRYAETTES